LSLVVAGCYRFLVVGSRICRFLVVDCPCRLSLSFSIVGAHFGRQRQIIEQNFLGAFFRIRRQFDTRKKKLHLDIKMEMILTVLKTQNLANECH
jgi:hypothetical protein